MATGEIFVDGTPAAPRPEYGRLVRKYLVLGILLVLLGAGAGFMSVAFFAPMYRARAVIEVQSGNDSFLKMGQSGERRPFKSTFRHRSSY